MENVNIKKLTAALLISTSLSPAVLATEEGAEEVGEERGAEATRAGIRRVLGVSASRITADGRIDISDRSNRLFLQTWAVLEKFYRTQRKNLENDSWIHSDLVLGREEGGWFTHQYLLVLIEEARLEETLEAIMRDPLLADHARPLIERFRGNLRRLEGAESVRDLRNLMVVESLKRVMGPVVRDLQELQEKGRAILRHQ